jgi:hypothetical protein
MSQSGGLNPDLNRRYFSARFLMSSTVGPEAVVKLTDFLATFSPTLADMGVEHVELFFEEVSPSLMRSLSDHKLSTDH